jgi:hypothetical protein
MKAAAKTIMAWQRIVALACSYGEISVTGENIWRWRRIWRQLWLLSKTSAKIYQRRNVASAALSAASESGIRRKMKKSSAAQLRRKSR